MPQHCTGWCPAKGFIPPLSVLLHAQPSAGTAQRRPLLDLVDKTGKERSWILLERPGDRDELNHIDAPLAALVFGHEGLWSVYAPGHFVLGQPC